jgi:uncharacterized protein (DUF488 family)
VAYSEMMVWTIGHSTRGIEEFVGSLKENNVQTLADVRRFPGSRRHPQFGQEQLSLSMRDAAIEYVHLPQLGGRRPALPNSVNTAWRNAAFRGYADYKATPAFAEGMKHLMNLASTKPTAIMCAEALWWQCHRGLLSDYLKIRGWEVLHIMGTAKLEPHPYTSAARIVNGTVSYEGDELPLPKPA